MLEVVVVVVGVVVVRVVVVVLIGDGIVIGGGGGSGVGIGGASNSCGSEPLPPPLPGSSCFHLSQLRLLLLPHLFHLFRQPLRLVIAHSGAMYKPFNFCLQLITISLFQIFSSMRKDGCRCVTC